MISSVYRDLTADQLRSLPSVRDDFDKANAEHKALRAAYVAENSRLAALFYDDLFAYHNIAKDHPLAAWLWSKAYEDGHSGGYGEIANVFDDLAEVIRIVEQNYTRK